MMAPQIQVSFFSLSSDIFDDFSQKFVVVLLLNPDKIFETSALQEKNCKITLSFMQKSK